MKRPMTRRDFKGNVWRELCAQAIERNCGYSRGYHDRYALSWDVAINWGVPDSDDLLEDRLGRSGNSVWAALFENYGVSRTEFMQAVAPDALNAWAEEWDDESSMNRVWSWVQEDMARGVTESDGYNTLRPEIANRYGLTYLAKRKYVRRTGDESVYYPAKLPGWKIEGEWANIPMYGVRWEFAGRGGKHLCLSEFEGSSLRFSSDDFADSMRNSEGDFTNEWCQNLLAFIHECDLMFTNENVKQEFEYQVAFRAAEELHELYEKALADAKEASEAAYWAERDVMTTA